MTHGPLKDTQPLDWANGEEPGARSLRDTPGPGKLSAFSRYILPLIPKVLVSSHEALGPAPSSNAHCEENRWNPSLQLVALAVCNAHHSNSGASQGDSDSDINLRAIPHWKT